MQPVPMNPLRWNFRAQCFLGFFICAGLLCYALYVQFVQQLEPCPFCIFQRLAFAATGVLFLLGALHGPRRPGGRRVYGVLAFLAAATGIGIAGRHVWVQLFPPLMPSCGPGWDYMIETNTWLGVVQKVLSAKGDCSTVDWSFLGLTMPMWSLAWFAFLAVWALWISFRARKTSTFR